MKATSPNPATEKNGEPRLVLLFGMPRSGTTWLGKIFDSHPDTLYRHEPDSQRRLLRVPLLVDTAEFESLRKEIEGFIRMLTDIRSAKVCAKLPLFPKRYYSGIRFALFRLGAMAAKFGERFTPGFPVLPFVDYRAVPDLAIAWKSIESLGRLGAIMRLTPSARSIILVRHPCGYVSSVLRGEAQGSFTSRTPSAEDWDLFEKLLTTKPARERGLTLSDIRRRTPAERLAWRWVLFNEKAMDDTSGNPGAMVVRYEDLCTDPQGVARQMFRHAGLPWSEQTADFLARSTTADDRGYYSVFKNPAETVNKWRKELAPADIERIIAVAENSRPGRLCISKA